MARALITGLSGQDGSYLAELLLERGDEVHGVVRGDSLGCAEHLRGRVQTHRADLLEPGSVARAIAAVAPQELYHLAAPTFVPESWEDPARVLSAVAVGTAEVLRAARDLDEPVRVLVASSSEIFGATPDSPQREDSPKLPTSPYGVAKLAAHALVGALRERHGLHASAAITFNHESPRRPERFVTRKVTRGAAAIMLGLQDELVLGDLDVVRDWSHAEDVMRGACLMLAQDEPADYVLASGRGRTVRELVEVAFAEVGLDPGPHVRVDERLVRGPEPVARVGDPSRARERLGWEPAYGFEAMIAEMVAADLAELSGSAA